MKIDQAITVAQDKFEPVSTAFMFHNADTCVELLHYKASSAADMRPENLEFIVRITVGGEEVFKIAPEAMSGENIGKLCELARSLAEPYSSASDWRPLA